MENQMDTEIRVLLDDKAEANHRQAVKGCLEELGFSVALAKEVYIRKSAAEHLPWIIFLYIVFRPFVNKLLESLGTEAGKDAWVALKDLFARIGKSRKSEMEPDGTIIVVDEETHLQIWIDNGELSDDAARSLLRIDLHSFRRGPVVWDEAQKRWKSITDEME
jgi:hypothetical protein